MRVWALLMAIAACHSVPAPAPITIGRSHVAVEGRPGPFTGNALYGQCLATVHVFLLTDSTPKASITIHPMGSQAEGRHLILPSRRIPSGVPADSTAAGPFYVEAVLPPDQVVEADSGWVTLKFDVSRQLHGTLEAWVGKGRRLTAKFLARRDMALEGNLAHGADCAR
jgi:hypothetical protein